MLRNIYINTTFYQVLGVIVGISILSFIWSPLYYVAIIGLIAMTLKVGSEIYQLNTRATDIFLQRITLEKWSLGEDHEIRYKLRNESGVPIIITVFDDLPFQLQYRDPVREVNLASDSEVEFKHTFKPLERGEYVFGNAYLMLRFVKFALIQFRKTIPLYTITKVYPSVIQMKKYAINISPQTASLMGVRKVRTLGENDEFEHLRHHRQGDDIKSVNWRASSRTGELIVNQYQDTKSQLVYSVIDTGRAMEMPFGGLSLLDYSINSALVLSKATIAKYDKAGLLCFSKETLSFLPAHAHSIQIENVYNTLYNLQTNFEESDYFHLFKYISRHIKRRSILFLFTNFETIHDLNRNLPHLRALNQKHLLIVIIFSNKELVKAAGQECHKVDDIYHQTFAANLHYEKLTITKKMSSYGIQNILTSPEDLSLNVINKYIEIKAKRMK